MNKPFSPPPLVQAPPGGFTADEFDEMIECGAFSDMSVELAAGFWSACHPQTMIMERSTPR
jgi:hypothetical protein